MIDSVDTDSVDTDSFLLKVLRTVLYFSTCCWKQEGLGDHLGQEPSCKEEGGVAVAIALCRMQLEQPVLPVVCAPGFAVRQMGLGMFKYGGGLGLEKEFQLDRH